MIKSSARYNSINNNSTLANSGIVTDRTTTAATAANLHNKYNSVVAANILPPTVAAVADLNSMSFNITELYK